MQEIKSLTIRCSWRGDFVAPYLEKIEVHPCSGISMRGLGVNFGSEFNMEHKKNGPKPHRKIGFIVK